MPAVADYVDVVSEGTEVAMAGAVASDPPVADRRRWLRRFVLIVAALVVLLVMAYLILFVVARLRLDAGEPSPFFLERPGEHQPLVFAHQGGELLGPSNTMVTFEHAAALGADVLDADMHRTADGALVLIHDQTVDRTSDGTGAVRNLTLDQLRLLDFGYTFSIDDGATFPFRGQGRGIVTVDEWFETFDDGIRFGIEIKQTDRVAAQELCATIHRFGYEDRVLVSSFGQPNMDAFRDACPNVATSATESEVRSFYIAYRLGLHGLVRPSYEAFQIPEFSGGRLILSEGFIDAARSWGLPVIPWTIDDPDDLERITALGVDGINTNVPDVLIEQVGQP